MESRSRRDTWLKVAETILQKALRYCKKIPPLDNPKLSEKQLWWLVIVKGMLVKLGSYPVDEQPMPPPINPGDPTVNFNLEVIVDDTNTTYSVTILEGENLYFGMIRLAYLDPSFTFVTSDSAFGQSIDAINGVADDADRSLFWTIHIGQEGTFAPRGIEGLYPTGETYIFILTDFS